MYGFRSRALAVALVFIILFPVASLADSRSLVGFMDLGQIVRSYFRESLTLQSIEALYARLAQVDAELEPALAELQEAMAEVPLLEAESRQELRDEMAELREEASRQTVSIRNQIALKQNSLLGSEDFARELSDAISDVATSGGFSMILPIQEDDSFWYNPDNVVTRDIIDRLVWLRDRATR